MPARILIIEDNPANLELMLYLLRAFGYVALTATDGGEGLEIALHEPLDLIICDVHLPTVDGYEVAKRLKHDPELAVRSIPLVAGTALAMVGDRERLLAAGFDGYIAKPITPESFVKEIEAFLPAERRIAAPLASVAESLQMAPDKPSPKPVKYRGRILVVDDRSTNNELVRSILEPSGYFVEIASNPGQALELARKSLPDLILTDLNMPGEDGLDLIRALQADPELASVKLVVNSASVTTFAKQREMHSLGVQIFLTRPIEPRRFLAEVEALLHN